MKNEIYYSNQKRLLNNETYFIIMTGLFLNSNYKINKNFCNQLNVVPKLKDNDEKN